MKNLLIIISLIAIFSIASADTISVNQSFTKYGYTVKLLEIEQYAGSKFLEISLSGKDLNNTYFRIEKSEYVVYRLTDYDFLVIEAEDIQSLYGSAKINLQLKSITSHSLSMDIDATTTVNMGYYKIYYGNTYYTYDKNKYVKGDIRIKTINKVSNEMELKLNQADIYYDSPTLDSILLEPYQMSISNISLYYLLKLGPPKFDRLYLYQKKQYGVYYITIDKINMDEDEYSIIIQDQDGKVSKVLNLDSRSRNEIILPNRDLMNISVNRLGAYPLPNASISYFVDLKVGLQRYSLPAGFSELGAGGSIEKDDVKLHIEGLYLASYPPKAQLTLKMVGVEKSILILENSNFTYEDSLSGRVVKIYVDRINYYASNWSAAIKMSIINPNVIETNFKLKKGWNMVFLPYKEPKLSGCNIENTKTYSIDSSGKYTPGITDSGFWIKADSDCSLKVIGYKLKQGNIVNLNQGWNFFGVLSEKSVSDLDSTCKLSKPVYIYENESFTEVKKFLPGESYAVKVPSKCNFDIG